MVVINMPGAAGITQANYMIVRAPKDGTSIGMINRQIAVLQLAGQQNVRFDAAKFQWIGGLAQEPIIVFVRRDTGFRSIDDMKKNGATVIFGSRAPGDTDYLAGRALEVLGVPLKIVSGYGAGNTTVAFEQGEFDASALSRTALGIRKEWTKPGGLAVPVLSLGGAVSDVPNGGDQRPAASRQRIYALINGVLGLPIGTFAGPPEMPDEVARTYSDAFAAMTKDPAFLDDAAKSGVRVEPLDGPTVKAMYKASMGADEADKKEFAELLK
jgi:tripartite-type tricarboxylate transporter receptor subunit TctC